MTVQTATLRTEASYSWSSVFALSLCVATLIASEFMPVSLLTPIAADLRLTEGQAGQAIAASGIFAVITSLLISYATQGIDRRVLLLALTALMFASGLIVGFAPTLEIFIAGRALLGVVIGGFWSMSVATIMRLVAERDVPRALAILNGGNALATTIAAPLGSFLGQYLGWRGAFLSVAPLAAVAFLWQAVVMPSMPSTNSSERRNVFDVLRHPQTPAGMTAVFFLFMGQFALFTYLRPFLETVTLVDTPHLSFILLIIGLAGLAGTTVIGLLVQERLKHLLIGMPLGMAAVALVLIGLGGSYTPTAVLLTFWGLIGTAAPVAWWAWLSRTMPNDAEAGGGLMVAVIQLAITAGAWFGGVLYDNGGYSPAFATSAALLCCSAALAAIGSGATRHPAASMTQGHH